MPDCLKIFKFRLKSPFGNSPIILKKEKAFEIKMENLGDYKNLLSMLVQKHMVILGPNIAVGKAREVTGLTVDEQGQVLEVNASPDLVLRDLVEGYFSLTGEVSRYFAKKYLVKFPEIKIKI